jgi:hypothetical protein
VARPRRHVGSVRSLASALSLWCRMANRYQYTVVELREGMVGGKMSGDPHP